MHTNVKMNAYKIDFICIQNCVLMHTNFFSSCPPLFAPLHRNLKQLCTQYLHSSKCTSRFVAFCFRQALQATSALVARHPALHCFCPSLRCRSECCRVPFTHRFTAIRSAVGCRSPTASLPFGVLSGAVHPSLHCHSERCRVPFTHRFTAVRDTVGCRSPIASLPFGTLSGAVLPSLHCRSECCRVPFSHRFAAIRDTVGCRSPIASLPFGVLSGCLKIGCQEVFYHPKKPSSYPSKSIRRGQKRHPATRHPAYQNRSILFHSLLLPLGARLHKGENRAVRFVGSFFFALIGKPPPLFSKDKVRQYISLPLVNFGQKSVNFGHRASVRLVNFGQKHS